MLLSLRVVLVWGLKQCFPLVGTLGHEWVPERTPVGAKRSGALGGFAESCASGLSWHNRPVEGETKLDFSAGIVCAFPGCTAPIVDTEHGVVTGEICHIKARSPEGPRYDPNQSTSERDGYENLMLMCGPHNKIIDDRATRDGFTVEMLQGYKRQHESRFHNTVVKPDVLSQFIQALSHLSPPEIAPRKLIPVVESFMTRADNQMGIDYYDFRVKLRNESEMTLREFRLEVEIPEVYASAATSSAAEVKEHGRGDVKLYRRTGVELGHFTLYPGETSHHVLMVDYQISHSQYRSVTESIKVILFLDDRRISTSEFAISEFLNKDRYAAIPLDRMSLSMYIGSSNRVKELDQRMAEANDIRLEKWDTRADLLLDRYLEKTQYLGISTIADLDESLKEHGEDAVRLARYFRVQERMHAGYCLDRMFDIKAAQGGEQSLLEMYTRAKLESGGETWAKEVWKAYEQVSKYS